MKRINFLSFEIVAAVLLAGMMQLSAISNSSNFESNLISTNQTFYLTFGSTEPSATKFIEIRPWDQYVRISSRISSDNSDDFCVTSELTKRSDSYRCFVGQYVLDPCFLEPKEGRGLLCPKEFPEAETYFHLRIVASPERIARLPDGGSEARPLAVRLDDGTLCRASSGTGPAGVDGFPYWRGECQGFSAGIWRSDEGMREIFPPSTFGGYWRIPISVGNNTSEVSWHRVQTIWY